MKSQATKIRPSPVQFRLKEINWFIFVHKFVFAAVQCVIVVVDCNVASTLDVIFNIVAYFSNMRNAF